MSSSSKRKILFLVGLIPLMYLLITFYLDCEAKAFEVYIGDSVVGYKITKEEAKREYESIVDNLNNNLKENEKVIKERLSFKRVNEDLKLSTYNEFKEGVINSIEGEGTLKALLINGKRFGYLIDDKDVEKVILKVGEIYGKNRNIDKDKISSINVKGNIKLKEEKTSISNINSIEHIANKIIEDDKNSLIVDLLVNDKRIVNIEPSVKVEKTEKLYIGETNIKEGKNGKKEQNVNITYRNGEEQDIQVLSENVIEKSESKIIYKGTKNPINNQVAFLKSPTRGGVITSTFGERWGRKHNGLDIAGNTGDPVLAAFDGIVKNSFFQKDGYGNVVFIEHEDGMETRYAHMSKIDVKVGDKVKKGDVIGKIGSTGRSTGPHLHFELRINGNPVNPEKYID